MHPSAPYVEVRSSLPTQWLREGCALESLGDETRAWLQMLVQFWVNHHLLSLLERPLWRVVSGRSRTYVNAVLAAMPGCVRVNSEVIGINREAAKVRLSVKQVDTQAVRDLGFDDVVLACHSDQSLAILVRVSPKTLRSTQFRPVELAQCDDSIRNRVESWPHHIPAAPPFQGMVAAG